MQLWRRLTKPVAKNSDDARVEYMTKVILIFLCLVSFPFFVISLFSWIRHIIPLDTVISLAVMMLLFIGGWVATNKGYRKIGGLISCLVLFATGVYGNYVGGIDAPAMLLYGLAIVLATIVFSRRAQFVILLLSIFCFLGLGLAHYNGLLITARSASNMFVNRVSIVIAALTALALGVWFLKHQYQLSINEIQTSANNTRALFETIIDGVVYSDLSGAVVDINEAAVNMFKLVDKQQGIGKNIVKFLVPEDKKLADTLYDTMLTESMNGSVKCTGLLPNGETIFLEVNSALFRDSSGKPTGFVSTLRDITQRKQIEDELVRYREQLEKLVNERTEKLKEAYDELESFSYSISHDLRSPLRSINGYISIIASEPENKLTNESYEYIEHIKDSSKRMGELITDLLAFSRLMRQPVTRKVVDPTEIANEVKKDLREGDYQDLDCDIQIEKMPVCEADPVLLRQVYFNLLDNACKYSNKQGRSVIDVGSKKGNNKETIYFVRDNGIGFDMQYAEKLFGVFQRLHSGATYEGTGIGLATVQRIIHRHNGKIWAESEINKGTTFFFTIEKNLVDNS